MGFEWLVPGFGGELRYEPRRISVGIKRGLQGHWEFIKDSSAGIDFYRVLRASMGFDAVF